ncbi:MAG: hypothetical protein KGL39_29620 [Patescibacteria group bacterium]|nr:hypothetical protein [Patescibacteria group bacterium]
MTSVDELSDEEAVKRLSLQNTAALLSHTKWLNLAESPDRGGKQLLPNDPDWLILIWRAGRGFGKQLCLETPVPTPSGWTTMGRLRAGDEVFDENGMPCNVTAAHPVDLTPESRRITFSDGTTIDACVDHLWVTWTHQDRKQYQRYQKRNRFPTNWVKHRIPLWDSFGREKGFCGPKVRTTAEIEISMTHGTRGDLSHCIPVALPLQMPDVDLPVDPYLLGYWLGNGDTACGAITTGSYKGNFDLREIMPMVLASYPDIAVRNDEARGQARIAVRGFAQALNQCGVLGNKHIPPNYLRAGYSQRLELLRGLCDSDGHVNAISGHIEFCSINETLAKQVLELVRSLGERPAMTVGRARLNGEDYGPKFRVTWRWAYGVKPFRLSRKADALNELGAQGLRLRHRMIVSIEPILPKPMRCISVDSPNHMYLAGEGMIPTHNTAAESQAMFWEMWRTGEPLIGHYLAATLSDVRGTIFEGPAGMRAVVPAECLKGASWDQAYNKSLHELNLANGSLIKGFATTEEGNRLRGPQCHFLAGDEAAAWDKPPGNFEIAFNNAMFGVRLPYPDGTPARAVFGTTPRPISFMKNLEKRKDVRVVRGSSYENLRNLSPSFRAQLLALQGTLIGKQEIEGDYIDEGAASLFKRSWFRLWPAGKKLPEFSFIVQSYDTASSEEDFDKKKQERDPTACTIWGIFNLAQQFTEEERRRMRVRGRYAALLCDAWAEHLGLPELLDKARAQNRIKWGSPGRRSDLVLIENKSSGIQMRQMLSTYGVSSWPYNPVQSKDMRYHAVTPVAAQGMIFVPESGIPERKGQARDWVEPFLQQVCAYTGPGSVEHDDYIDSFSQAIIYLKDQGMLEVKPEIENLDYEETREKLQREAVGIQEKTRERTSPYGA